jgi:hypothetical protein
MAKYKGERGMDEIVYVRVTKADAEAFRRLLSDIPLQDRDLGERLLHAIYALFEGWKGEDHPDRAFTHWIVEALNKDEEAPWHRFNSGRGMSNSDLYGMLSKFGIERERNAIRAGGGNQARGFLRHSFEDAWERYGVTGHVTAVKAA